MPYHAEVVTCGGIPVLHYGQSYGTDRIMLQAYLGIVSRQGLEVFCPEHPQTLRFLRRHAEREAGRVACFWSVVPDETVGTIQTALRLGFHADALSLLQQQAHDYGLLSFPDDESLISLTIAVAAGENPGSIA